MRIGLISPKVNFSTNIKELNDFWYSSKEAAPYRNLWSGVSSALLTIAALTPSSHEVRFIDENFEAIDFREEYDLVGISAMTQQVMQAYKIADEFRKNKVSVVLGGIHPTLLPEEAIQHADSVVVGEAEYIWEKLLTDFQNKRLKPFYKSDKVVDLKDSPIPRFDLLNSRNYKYVCLQTTRGCPHDCEYCSASKIYGPRYRKKTIKQIIREINEVKIFFKNPSFFFTDDNFLVDRLHSVQLLEDIVSLRIRWHCQCDISIGKDQELLNLLRKSGCGFVFVGLESISEEGLRNIDSQGWKYKQFKNYSSFIQNIQSHGVGVMGAFMVGLESDNFSVFNKIFQFIEKNNLYAASVTILTPVPGTRLRARLINENRLLPSSWEDYTGYNLNFIPKGMTVEEMKNGLSNLYQKIYNKDLYYRKMIYFKEMQKKLNSA